MPGAWETSPDQVDVVVAIPYIGASPLTIDWLLNTMNLVKPANTRVVSWRGLPVDVARNRLIKEALKLKAKWIFYLDADVLPPAYAIPRLMGYKLPIVSGLYRSKLGYAAIWSRDPEVPAKYNPISLWRQGGLLEVDAVPGGCLLIDTRVLEIIPEPWFEWEIDRKPDGLSEDITFCRKAQDYGFPIYVDLGVECHHEHLLPVGPRGQAQGMVLLPEDKVVTMPKGEN